MSSGCLDDDRLVEILGLDDQLSFTDNIEFPEMGDVAEDFQFDGFSNFSDDAQTVDYTTFYGPGNDALDGINQLIADCLETVTVSSVVVYDYAACTANKGRHYGRSNYTGIDPSDYYDPSDALSEQQWEAMANLTDVLYVETLTLSAFEDVADDIKAEIQAVVDQSAVIENDTAAAVDRVNDAEAVLDPVFVIVDGIVDTARCGFVGDGYLDIHHVLCQVLCR